MITTYDLAEMLGWGNKETVELVQKVFKNVPEVLALDKYCSPNVPNQYEFSEKTIIAILIEIIKEHQ